MWKFDRAPARRPSLELDCPFFSILAASGFALVILGQPSAAFAQLQCLTNPMPPECVSFEFQANVTSVVDPGFVLGPLSINDTIGGMITINTAIPDTDPGPDDGFYPDAIECVRINLAGRSLVFALDPTLPIEDRRMEVVNDLPEAAGGFMLFSDSVGATTGGFATMDISALPPEQDIRGAAAFAYAYSKTCIQGIQSPCPPALLTDDSIPDAPGNVTSLDTTPLNFRFADLFGTGTLSLVQADLTDLDPSAPIPCPEPSVTIAGPASVLWLAMAARARRKSAMGLLMKGGKSPFPWEGKIPS